MPAGYSRWDGWQLGAQFGLANMNTDFGIGTTTLPADTSNSHSSVTIQYSELVLGADLAYKRPTNLDTAAGDSITALSTLKLVDYATLRARAGYAVGQFLPYAVVGFAVGRFNHATTVLLSSEGQDNAFVAVGLGMDVAIMPNMFLRAE